MTSPKIELDLDFVLRTAKQGAEMASLAVQSAPEKMEGFLEAGWHIAIRERSKQNSRYFLRSLILSDEPDFAKETLIRFFDGAPIEEINLLLMSKENPDANEPSVFNWLLTMRDDNTTCAALMEGATELGVDLEAEFSFSVTDTSGKSKSSKHTVLSAIVANRAQWSSTIQSGDELGQIAAKTLLSVGKKFDKNTAAFIMQSMKPPLAMKWFKFFKEEQAVSASKMIQWTSRMKLEPEVLALVQAEAARESVDQMLSSSPRPL